MKKQSNTLHHREKNSFNIEADEKLYRQIVEDMMKNAGNFIPRSVWQKLYDDRDLNTIQEGAARYEEVQYTDEQVEENAYEVLKRYHNMRIMMAAWVGCNAEKNEFEENALIPYRKFLTALEDPPELLDKLIENKNNNIMADFRTAEEVTMISKLTEEESKLCVLEIGGGYGRLAEGLMNVYGNHQIHYIMADSVPISLMYCYLYLKKEFTDLKVGIWYKNPEAAPSDYDIYIIPTWRLETICVNNHIKCNLLVNIQSMQEMSQWHVDYYLNLFDKVAAEKAWIFLNNNKKYIFKGKWNYPQNWRLIFRQNTPCSWSDDCPAEVFIREEGNFDAYNALINLPHRIAQDRDKAISELTEKTSFYHTELENKEKEITKKKVEIENKEREIVQKSGEIENKEKEIAQKSGEIESKEKEIAQKSGEIESKEKEIAQKNAEIENKEREIAQKNAKINMLNNELIAIKDSFSWKITKPLRALKKLFLKLAHAVLRK